MLQRVGHTSVMIQVMQDREDPALYTWYNSMKRLCQAQIQF